MLNGKTALVRYDGADLSKQAEIETMIAKAALAMFLTGDSAASITGAIMPIEGGWTAQ